MADAIERQLLEDRALRDAAKALVQADIEHLKTDFGAKDIKSRITGRLTEGAVDVFEEAVEVAEDNKTALVTLVIAIGLWFARNPLMALFSDKESTEVPVEGDELTAQYDDPAEPA